jgi:hypothetical protein
MAAWAPPAPERVHGPWAGGGRKSLGFPGLPSLNFDKTTLLSATIGGAGILLADAFGPPGSTLIKVAGFGALGYAVYRLFGFDSGASPGTDTKPLPYGTGTAEAKAAAEAQMKADKEAADKKASEEGKPPPPAGDVNQVSGVILSPTNNQQLGPSDYNGFWEDTSYNVSYQLINYSEGPVTVSVEYRVAYYYPPSGSRSWYSGGVRTSKSTVFKSFKTELLKVPPRFGEQAGILLKTLKMPVDYDRSATEAQAVLYIYDKPVSPVVKYFLHDTTFKWTVGKK